jgi:hypothetical protein
VVIERSLYREAKRRNGPTVDPVSLRAGVMEAGWLPHTAQAMAFLMQQGTAREAEQSAKKLGRLPYGRSSFDSVAHALGQRYLEQEPQVEQELIEAYRIPQEATGVSVSLDRISVPMEELNPHPPVRPPGQERKREILRNFRMAYCGTVTVHDGQGRALHTIRYGRMPKGDAVGLCEGLASDVDQMRKKRPDLKVGLVADGSEEMWNLMEEQLNQRTLGVEPNRLVDFCHVVEKLNPAAQVLDGDKASSRSGRWRLDLLNNSDAASRILSELRASGQEWRSVGEGHPVHEAITYVENHADRMDYAKARREGRPIGSGHVEATGKSLFEVRMKRSGSRWKDATGEDIVRLRALGLSDRWDAAMSLLLAPLRKEVQLAA